jgi:tellurite resistance-related uncharacterized protein
MNGAFPAGLELYKQTPTFTELTVPQGLLRDHSTKERTWGLIRVEHGQLRYTITDERRSPSSTILSTDTPGLVEPTIRHHVEPIGAVRFCVQFYTRPSE